MLYFNEDLTGPEYAKRFTEKALDSGVEAQTETMVAGLSTDKEIRATSTKQGHMVLNPKSIVMAMGCRERPRASIGIPGTRPAGIFTAGTAQRFINVEGFTPGERIVILGSGDIGMIMARRLTLEGARVEAVVEVLPYVGGLIRNAVQCVHDFDIPLFLEHTLTRVQGEERVEGVTISRIDKTWAPIPGTETNIDCDTLLLSVGLIPENELSQMAGVRLDPVTGGPFVDENRQTNVPGIFAGGNVVQVHDLVDNVSWEAELAGEAAARFAKGERMAEGQVSFKPGRNIRYVAPQKISGENDVTLYMRVREPEEKVQVKVGDVASKKFMGVKPSEMIKLDISSDKLKKIKEGTTEISVDCHGKE